ncbi:MAG: 4-alpha-glucanotransferase [Pseudanabaenaceae cyanobacterium SKYGB_i_bin29]|nr:4-alpha-glucanotransferase [Pseudanabaenaceae cyanobacterium SKYG29]MDW8420252.1 4-alpha-glucanotransferase [Pseudanabaenaceae cyanobacterium SKYGB_i_bin29]
MQLPRASGILLHPTSLPSPYGIGDLGSNAYHFVDFLQQSGQKFWQVLPLTPTGYGNSPYMSFSAIAGNPLLISPELLIQDGLLEANRYQRPFPADVVDFDQVIPYKQQILQDAYTHFLTQEHLQEAFTEFCEVQRDWLEDYALFMALTEVYPNQSWCQWQRELARRDPQALAAAREKLEDTIGFHKFQQYCFYKQWQNLRQYANERQIQIIGDIPIYVAHHSADVWAHPQNFALDPETLEVAFMAGVPPDYFSPTGQLWGNPIYNWDYMEQDGFRWWINRFEHLTKLVDWIRIDHFRGFDTYWQVPAGETTAIKGEWQEAPGEKFFTILLDKLGSLPILAEDLGGDLRPEVAMLREKFGFPTMKVLVFAFGGDSSNAHLPHHFQENTVVYTGTHDNDTVLGWWLKISSQERSRLVDYWGLPAMPRAEDVPWLLIRIGLASVARLCIIPMQDVLGLDNGARMNRPGLAAGNWAWRYTYIPDGTADKLRHLTHLYSR